MSLQLLHGSRTTVNIKMLLEWALESVANPTTIISMSREWDLFSMHGSLTCGSYQSACSTGEESRTHSSGEAT